MTEISDEVSKTSQPNSGQESAVAVNMESFGKETLQAFLDKYSKAINSLWGYMNTKEKNPMNLHRDKEIYEEAIVGKSQGIIKLNTSTLVTVTKESEVLTNHNIHQPSGREWVPTDTKGALFEVYLTPILQDKPTRLRFECYQFESGSRKFYDSLSEEAKRDFLKKTTSRRNKPIKLDREKELHLGKSPVGYVCLIKEKNDKSGKYEIEELVPYEDTASPYSIGDLPEKRVEGLDHSKDVSLGGLADDEPLESEKQEAHETPEMRRARIKNEMDRISEVDEADEDNKPLSPQELEEARRSLLDKP